MFPVNADVGSLGPHFENMIEKGMIRFMASIHLLLAVALVCRSMAAPVPLRAETGNGKELEQVPIQADGRTINAWRCGEEPGVLVFRPAAPSTIPPDGDLYLKISFLDDAYGELDVGLVPEGGNPIRPDLC